MLFKDPVRTSKRTPHLTITKINWLTLFKEIIAVYSKVTTLNESGKQSWSDLRFIARNREGWRRFVDNLCS
jgi:hypothetical protein